MSSATDRLAALTNASFENGGHRDAFVPALHDVATVGNDVAAQAVQVAADAAASAADRAQTGEDRVAASSSASAAGASVPATADRTLGRRLNDAAIWSMIRSTKTWDVGADGRLTEVAVDNPCWAFDPSTLAPLGMQFQPARQNLFTNPRLEGAVVGTPGTLPADMSIAASGAGVSYAVVGAGAMGAVNYVDVRFYGTVTATSIIAVKFGALYTPPGGFLATDRLSISVTDQLLAGVPPTGNIWRLASTTPATFNPGNVSSTPRRCTAVVGFSGPQPNAQASYSFTQYAIGTVLDFTIRFSAPMVEIGPAPSVPVLPPVAAPAIGSRAQGTVTIPVEQLGARLSRRKGMIIVDWCSQPGPFTSANDADWLGLISIGDTSAGNVLGLVINPAHTSIEARLIVAGVPQTPSVVTIAAPAAGTTIRTLVSWDLDTGVLQVCARGVVGSKVALAAMPAGITHVMPGRNATLHPLAGYISGLDVRPAPLYDAAAAALT